MLRTILKALLVSSMLLSGCDTESISDNSKEVSWGRVTVSNFPTSLTSDAFQISGATVTPNYLELAVVYGGGCSDHRFGGLIPEVIPMIYPPKIEVTIVHDNGDDQCRAIVSDTVTLDLGDLKTFVNGEMNLVIVPLGTEDHFFLYHAP